MKSTVDYGLTCPSRETTLDVLNRAFGIDQGLQIWVEACLVCQTSINNPTLEELHVIFTHFSRQPGILGIYGTSLKMRLTTYRCLAGA